MKPTRLRIRVPTRRAVLGVLIGTALGATVIVLLPSFWPALQEWMASEPARIPARARLVMAGAGALYVVPLVALAAYLWRLGARTLRAQHFPPPGTLVVHGTRVLTGDAARRWGRLTQGFAVFFGVAAIAMAVLFWHLSDLLAGR